MNFPDWEELCISSQNQRRDLVGEVVACTGEHISYYISLRCVARCNMCLIWTALLTFDISFTCWSRLFFYCFLILFCCFSVLYRIVLFCHTTFQILVSVFLCACLCIFAMCVVHIGSQENKCLPFKCIHRVPVFDIFQNSLNLYFI